MKYIFGTSYSRKRLLHEESVLQGEFSQTNGDPCFHVSLCCVVVNYFVLYEAPSSRENRFWESEYIRKTDSEQQGTWWGPSVLPHWPKNFALRHVFALQAKFYIIIYFWDCFWQGPVVMGCFETANRGSETIDKVDYLLRITFSWSAVEHTHFIALTRLLF